MSYKDTNINNPGTPTQYGADDMENIVRNFNGQIADLPPVTIKNQNKWGFWDSILFFRNQSDTWDIIIRGPTNNPGNDFELTLPPITANDTLPALGLAQTWTLKQRYNAGVVFPELATPAAPGLGLHNVYVATNGHLVKIDNDLTIKDYDVAAQTVPIDVKDGTLTLRTFDTLVTKHSSTYYAIKYDGTVLSSGTNPNTVIDAAIADKGRIVISIANSQNIVLESGFTGFTILADTYIYLNAEIQVPNGYTGFLFNITGENSGIFNIGDSRINESGTSANNWTAIKIGTGTSVDAIHSVTIRELYIDEADKAIEFVQGSTGDIEDISIEDCAFEDCKKFISWTCSDVNRLSEIVLSNNKFNASSAVTTDIFKDVKGRRIQFYGNMLIDVTAAMSEMTIASGAINTMIFGGNHTGVNGTYTDLGTDTYIDDSTHTEFKLKGSALSPAQIIANQNDYSPSNWNEKVNTLRLTSDASRNITGLVPGANPKNRIVIIENIGSNNIVLTDEDTNSTAANRFALNSNFTIIPDSSVIIKYDSTSSRWRTLSFAGAALGVSNTYTEPQFIQKDTTSPLLELRRLASAVTNAVRMDFQLWNASSVLATYARLAGVIVTNTAGAEDGNLELQTIANGVLATRAKVRFDGDFEFGSNLRGRFSESLLTSQRTLRPSNGSGTLPICSHSNATVTISNTTAETDIFTFSVGANALGANGIVKFYSVGYLLQNQATGTTWTFKIIFGGTTMWQDVSPSIAQSATKLPFRIEGELYNKNATNAQFVSGRIMINDTTAATTGIGDISDDEILVNANFDSEGADTTKDTTLAQTLQITVTHSVASSNVQTVVKSFGIQLITL